MIDDELASVVDQALSARTMRLIRIDAIMNAPEAEGRPLLAFALALRSDLTADVAVRLLGTAPPDLKDVAAVSAFCVAVPTQSDLRPVQ